MVIYYKMNSVQESESINNMILFTYGTQILQ
jgi:hypothetical protein